jgi:hypothetical protein
VPAAPPLPPLNDSDPVVRESLEAYALPAPWIEQDELVRRLAVVVDNAARGTYPRSQLAFLAPAGKFKVTREGAGSYRIDPESYRRYDDLVAAATAVPPPDAAALLQRFGPLLDLGLGELGNRTPWRDQVTAAIQELLAVPVVAGEVPLDRPKVMYTFADPKLERLSPLQKQLLRAGPENVTRVQLYLRRLSAALGLDIN